MWFSWGKIPNSSSFLGLKFAHQAVFFDPAANSIGIAFTRGLEQIVAPAYDTKITLISALYSYGAQSTAYNGLVKPNTEPAPRYFYRRAPILKIN